ncbi:MAG: hypothetical protein U5J83_02945 [Bryobacterales bacterium]|nr:hypothetical protein [Bryobacterales bacterium]
MAETRQKNPGDVLQSYRRWKEEGEALKAQAQSLLVERFHELVQEAQQVQHDLYEDFGHTVKFPVNPKFAKRGKARPAARKTAVAAARAAPAMSPAAPAPAPVTKVSAAQKASGGGASLRMSTVEPAQRSAPGAGAKKDTGARALEHLSRQVDKARQRLAEAKVSGGAVKIQNAEDRLYELSDELRLMTANAAERA